MGTQMHEKKRSLKQTAYEYIKGKILACEYRPGMFLNEQLLCGEMGGISRTPVRDALGRLEQEGLVTILPKKGVIVSEVRLSDINRIYEVRILLEPYVLRKYGSHMDLKEMARMKKLLSSTARAVQNHDYYYNLDDQFHAIIMNLLPNNYLMDTYANISNLNRRFRVLSGDEVENRIATTFEEHLAIADACLAEDWEGAAEAVTFHLEQSRKAAFHLMIDSEQGM